MVDPFEGKWNKLDETSYLDQAKATTKVIWLGRPTKFIVAGIPIVTELSNDDLIALFRVSGLETKSYLISSYGDWEEFSKSCHTIWYKDGKDWKDRDAQNYNLHELVHEREKDPKFIRHVDPATGVSEFDSDIIVTAYDPEIRKRLIVDGIHRAVILTNETKQRTRIPRAMIYECQGRAVDRIFPCDFPYLKIN